MLREPSSCLASLGKRQQLLPRPSPAREMATLTPSLGRDARGLKWAPWHSPFKDCARPRGGASLAHARSPLQKLQHTHTQTETHKNTHIVLPCSLALSHRHRKTRWLISDPGSLNSRTAAGQLAWNGNGGGQIRLLGGLLSFPGPPAATFSQKRLPQTSRRGAWGRIWKQQSVGQRPRLAQTLEAI